MITSIQNETVKELAKLKQKKHRDEQNAFLIEGVHLVEEAMALGLVKKIISTDEVVNYPMETIHVSESVMKSLSDVSTPPGIMAVCQFPNQTTSYSRVLLLDGIQDPGNMGTLIRSAVAFGFDAIVAMDSVDFTNPKVIRATQGAWFKVSLVTMNLVDFIRSHPELTIYSTDVESGVDMDDNPYYASPLALLIGSESSGVSDELQAIANVKLHISMEQTESLNAGVAGSILMHDIYNKTKKESS